MTKTGKFNSKVIHMYDRFNDSNDSDAFGTLRWVLCHSGRPFPLTNVTRDELKVTCKICKAKILKDADYYNLNKVLYMKQVIKQMGCE